MSKEARTFDCALVAWSPTCMVVAVEMAAPPTPLPGADSPRVPSSVAIERKATVTGVVARVVVVLEDVEVVVVEVVVGGMPVVLVVVDEDVVLEVDDVVVDVVVVEKVVVLDEVELVVELVVDVVVDDDVLVDVVVPGLASARNWLASMVPRPVTRSWPTPALKSPFEPDVTSWKAAVPHRPYRSAPGLPTGAPPRRWTSCAM